MKKMIWALLPVMQAHGTEPTRTEDVDTIATCYLHKLQQHPEQHMDTLYATLEVIVETEPTLVYTVAAQYWQDDYKEAWCEEHKTKCERTTLVYELPSECQATALEMNDLATEFNRQNREDPIANMGYMYLATTIAIRHAPNGVYLHEIQRREEDFIEEMQALGFALERIAQEGFDYSHDLNDDE
jgi:hypothetical protein